METLRLLVSTSKASGIDKISAKFLKIAAPFIASHALIFSQLIRTGIFPCDWKIARVTPIGVKRADEYKWS